MFENLVKKAQNGNKEAFEKLIKQYQDILYIVAKSHLHQEDDVYDAIQETIISVYESIHQLKNICSFKAWMIKILINKCHTIYQEKNKIRQVSVEELEYEKYFYENNNLFSDIEFENLLKPLSEEEKLIMILYFSKQYKTKEIAEVLALNESTIRSKIKRAKKKIENDLKGVL